MRDAGTPASLLSSASVMNFSIRPREVVKLRGGRCALRGLLPGTAGAALLGRKPGPPCLCGLGKDGAAFDALLILPVEMELFAEAVGVVRE